MAGLVAVFYGIAAYAVFVGSLLYAIGFVGNLIVPKSIDSGMPGPLLESLAIDVLLLGLFAVQHSVMARPAFKRWWTLFVPRSVERSTYVLFASLVLVALYYHWQPIPTPVWTVRDPLAAGILDTIFWSGWALLLVSTFLISHFELFGLKQVSCACSAANCRRRNSTRRFSIGTSGTRSISASCWRSGAPLT